MSNAGGGMAVAAASAASDLAWTYLVSWPLPKPHKGGSFPFVTLAIRAPKMAAMTPISMEAKTHKEAPAAACLVTSAACLAVIRSLLYRTIDGILGLVDTPARIVRRNLRRFRHRRFV